MILNYTIQRVETIAHFDDSLSNNKGIAMTLSDEERRILLSVLDLHLDGMADARERMIEDNVTLTSFETFSETLQQHDIDTHLVESIKRKVLEDDSAPVG